MIPASIALGGGMRGRFLDQAELFSYLSGESPVPAGHPLRPIRDLVRELLTSMTRKFSPLYASEGWPSVPPDQVLSALLLQAV